jgi:hypothetical protein
MYNRFHEMSEMVICATNSSGAALSTTDHELEPETAGRECGRKEERGDASINGHGTVAIWTICCDWEVSVSDIR